MKHRFFPFITVFPNKKFRLKRFFHWYEKYQSKEKKNGGRDHQQYNSKNAWDSVMDDLLSAATLTFESF